MSIFDVLSWGGFVYTYISITNMRDFLKVRLHAAINHSFMYKYNSFSGVCHWMNTRKLATFEISCLKFEISCLKNCFRIKCGTKRIIVLGSVQN